MSKRKGLLDFCGSPVDVEYDPNGPDSREGFRMYDDGQFKGKTIKSRHPNVLQSVIIGKKSWGYGWISGLMELRIGYSLKTSF